MKFIISFALLYSFSSFAHKSPFVPRSQKNLEQSVLIKRVSDQKILYQDNPHKALTPASLAKLFCAASFLKSFGKLKGLKTTFHYSGQNRKGKVSGDLIIKGSGDPKLINEDLWKIAHDMKHLGYKEFSGNIVIDNSLFSQVELNKGRTKKLSQHTYDAPISAFGVNFNTYNIVVAPGKRAGLKAHVSLYPYPLEGTIIRNYVKTVTSKKKNYIGLRRRISKGREIIEAHGRIHVNSRLRKFYRSSYDPIKFSGETLRSFLKAQNIIVKGKVRTGKLANYKKAKKILSYRSETMANLTKDFLLYSNNYMTDMLVSTLGAHSQKKSQEKNFYEAGLRVIRNILPKNLYNKKSFTLTSGSGLETDNKISSHHVVELLLMISKNFEMFPEFLNALPKSGINGTLKKRFKQSRMKSLLGKVRAKTGTLTQPVSVSSLAGYLQHKTHGIIAFSIIQNGISGKKQPNILVMRQAQEIGLVNILKKI